MIVGGCYFYLIFLDRFSIKGRADCFGTVVFFYFIFLDCFSTLYFWIVFLLYISGSFFYFIFLDCLTAFPSKVVLMIGGVVIAIKPWEEFAPEDGFNQEV